MNKKISDYVFIIVGATILSCGIYNIHHVCGITEGGELGLELLIDHWLHISPAISAVIMDTIFYGLGWLLLGNTFAFYAVLATLCYSVSYHVWESLGPFWTQLASYPLLAAIIGALFVGIGCGMVVRVGGACGGDDAIALVLNKKTKLPIGICYLVTDLTILILSLSYIPFNKIIYSIITVNISSFLIQQLHKEEST